MKNIQEKINFNRNLRKKRTRAKIFGTAQKPRLSIFRSNRYTYAQLINDEKGNTLAEASTKKLISAKQKISKSKQAEMLGELLAEKALALGIKKACFDRGAYQYHGRIKAAAEAARKKGLQL